MKEFSNYTNMGIGDMRMNIDLYSQHIVYGSYSAKFFHLALVLQEVVSKHIFVIEAYM